MKKYKSNKPQADWLIKYYYLMNLNLMYDIKLRTYVQPVFRISDQQSR